MKTIITAVATILAVALLAAWGAFTVAGVSAQEIMATPVPEPGSTTAAIAELVRQIIAIIIALIASIGA